MSSISNLITCSTPMELIKLDTLDLALTRIQFGVKEKVMRTELKKSENAYYYLVHRPYFTSGRQRGFIK